MDFHVLNGDALIDRFEETGLEGRIVVMREALISGDLSGDTRNEFYRNRAAHLIGPGPKALQDYFAYSVSEFDKLVTAGEGDQFFLWFGYDLFCRMNMLFIISLIQSLSLDKKLFVVYPSYLSENEVWEDFGNADHKDLLYSYQNAVEMHQYDLAFAAELWDAFRKQDLNELEKLSTTSSNAFPYLQEVCKAHVERFSTDNNPGRPEKVIREIIHSGKTDFLSVFSSFYEKESIYGFGDLQLKEIYDRVVASQ